MLRGRHVLLSASVLLLGLGSIAKTSTAATPPDWQNGVLKIEVVRNDGKKDLGSAVLIAPERLLTNCHVVRNARDITVFQGKASWPASPDGGDTFRDLCVLKLPGFPGKPATIAEPGKAKVGDHVSAVGFSAGKFKVSTGRIKGLFTCACDGGRVIQTSAQFDPGASGGGLFDANGELIGILTFKAQSGGMFHFAIPVGWMKALSALPPSDVPDQRPFWVNPSTNNGYFLAACDLSAKKKWRDLSRLAQEWVREDRFNPQAWMALGRANLGLKRPREAAGDFKKVLELDPAHAEALWELQQLELELGESLLE